MNLTTDLREDLQSLSISKDQRPRGNASAAARFPIGKVFLLGVLGGGGYLAWQNWTWLTASVSQAASSVTSPKAEIISLVVRAQSEQASPPVHTGTGKIVSDHTVSVVTKVSGQIVELRFEQGDRVEVGQILARIEEVNYRARRDEAAAMVAKAEANLRLQEFEFNRMSQLAKDHQASEKEVVAARAALDQAKAQLLADQAALVWSNKALADTEVVAPIAGVVLERNVEVGDFVAAEGGRGANANALFAVIADMSKLRVEIDISELDVARIRRDMPCVIVPDAYKDRKYFGHVMWIDPGANYAKATVQTKVRIDDPDAALRVDGSAQVQFFNQDPRDASSQAAAPVIWIPSTAVGVNGEPKAGESAAAAYVFRILDEKLVKTPIKIGRRQGGQSEVLEGLSDGDKIVQKDTESLRENQPVR